MATCPTACSVAVTMSATATHSQTASEDRGVRPIDEIPHRDDAPVLDATAPVRRAPAPHRDDESHTPPHGDAVLPRRKPAR